MLLFLSTAIILAGMANYGAWAGGIVFLILAFLVWKQHRRLRLTKRQIDASQTEHQRLLHSLEVLNVELEDRVQRRTETVESGLTALRLEITERQRAQERLQRQIEFEHLLAVISTDFLNVHADQCHELIQSAIGSLHDFLHVDAIGIFEFSQNHQLLALIAESSQGGKPCYGIDFPAQTFRKISELPVRRHWEQPLKRQSVKLADTQDITTDLTDDERAYFRVREIQAFVHVPLVVETSVIGFIGLRNLTDAQDWNPTLIAQVELVAQVFANALYRKRTDEEIAELQRFGTLISKVSGNFVDLPTEQINSAIETSLQQLGEFIGATRCSIYQMSSAQTTVESVFEWIAPGAPPEIPEAKRLTLAYFPWFQQCYREGTPIAMSSIYDIPSYAAPERTLLTKLQAKSLLAMPMRLGGRPIGHVGFSIDKPHHPWSSDLIDQARLIADLFANALERKRKEQALAESELRYRTIVEDQTEWILRWRPDGTRIFVNESYCTRFGQSADALLGTNFLHEALPEDQDRIRSQIAALTPENPVTTQVHKGRKLDGSVSWEQWTDRAFFDEEGKVTEIQSVAFDMTEQRLAEQRTAALQRDFQQTLINSQEAERARIARELHDELGQSLTALRMHARAMQKRLEDEPTTSLATFDTSLEEIIGIVDTTIPEVRRICAELRPSLLDNLGLVAAMEWQLDKFQQNTGIRCNEGFLMSELPTHPQRDIAMFRIFQELLTNVARHAKATDVWISLRLSSEKQLILEVRDNGRGVRSQDIEQTTHFGLLGIHERAAAIGGTFSIKGTPEVGTTATVSIAAPDLATVTKDDSDPSEIESSCQDDCN